MEKPEAPKAEDGQTQMESTPHSFPTPPTWQWYWRQNVQGEADCGVFWEERAGMAFSVCRAPRYVKKEQWEADARLIVKAHDLLWALSQILSELPTRRDWLDPDLEKAARAIVADSLPEASVPNGGPAVTSVSSTPKSDLGTQGESVTR